MSRNAFHQAQLVASIVLLGCLSTASAAPTYQVGKINNVTFVTDTVFIKLDSGLPDNCAGTAYGWMAIPSSLKQLQAWVTGLWLRGDMANVTVTVYTSGLVSGYCQVNQLDPAE